MKCELSEQQLNSYRAQGFLVVEGFLEGAELEDWRACTDEAVSDRLAAKDRWLNNQGDTDSYYSQVFTQCLKLLETHEGMRRLLLDERLGRMAGTLAGVDGIRIWHDQALIKPPFGNPTAWHLDNPYWSFTSANAISLWIALDDATLGNGCLWYLPGTHRSARNESVDIGENMADLFKHFPEWKKIEPVATPCPAGSAVFHNGLVAHAAGANMTNRPRRAMTCAYMPDGSRFNGTCNVLPPEYFDSLKIGDILNNDTVNPLVWKA